MTVAETRIRRLNDGDIDPGGELVVYWMVATRRATYNFGLQRARDLAVQLGRPLMVLEALRYEYPFACDRFHAFILDGMADNRRAFAEAPVRYYPFVGTPDHPGKGLIERLAEEACAVVTDDFPAFFIPHMLEAAAGRVDVRLEAVDSNGVMPMRGTDRLFKRAWDYRRHIHNQFAETRPQWPQVDPLDGVELPTLDSLPDQVSSRWPEATDRWLDSDSRSLDDLPLDHSIAPNPALPGGADAACERLGWFLRENLDDYHRRRNDVCNPAESGLSPYFHFGHISSHRVFDALSEHEDWDRSGIDDECIGKREGFWGMSPGAEEFVDQFVSWREVGINRCALDPEGYDDYETLPGWAKTTLEEHRDDPRPQVYTIEQFEEADTHDPLWNAAQNQLVQTGTMHNYMRMLWGKKILHWTPTPQRALQIMIELNDTYAVDGRDPNSYNGIFWVLGRYDRAWGPEREVFGKVRYMTSDGARRKYDVDEYLRRFG